MPPSKRLERLADWLEVELGDAVEVVRSSSLLGLAEVRVVPGNGDSLGVWWFDGSDELIVETFGGAGGRWELGRTDRDVELVESIVRAVVDGRVSEVFGPGRSRVTVTLADGQLLSETGLSSIAGCLPLPFWTRWGRTVHYAPYSIDPRR